MQAVMNNTSGFGAAARMHFAAGRDYMMRSEKRGGSRPPSAGGNGKKPPKRRRRKRAGFFYKLFMMILLLVLWPLGLLMLWRRKVRWGAGTKLLTSVVTLAACIILIGFLLTVNTGNAQYSAIQNSINDFLDDAADSLVIVWEEAETQAMMVSHGVQNLSEAVWISVREDIADGIDAGVEIGKDVRATVESWISGAGNNTVNEADVSAEPEISATPEASALPEATMPPVAEISIGADASALPVYIPETEPAFGETIESGMLNRDGVIDTAAVPEPLAAPAVFIVKPATDAIVYYNEGGKCYHMASSCGSMLTAAEHTLGDTLESSVHRCSTCKTPDKSILDEAYIVWTDDSNSVHLSDECAKFSGKWNIIPAEEAIDQRLTACYECEADEYLVAIAMQEEIVIEAPEKVVPESEDIAEISEENAAEAGEAAETDAETEAEDAVLPLSANEETETAFEAAIEAAAEEAEPTATPEPKATPTAEPTATPTAEPTATPEPTASPTAEPTASPTAEPTATPEPTASPTAEPTATPEPTAEPTAEPEPTATLKPAGMATVYHTKGGKWYHTIENCSGMMGASPYTMEESAEGYKSCNTCAAPKPDLIGKDCLWMDKNKLCHTSDECELFEGRYTLVLIEDALQKKYIGCEKCLANKYLEGISIVDGNIVYYEEILVVEVTSAP